MRLRRSISILGALLLLVGAQHAGPVAAQGDVNLSIEGVDHEGHPSITIRATVRNNQGIPILGIGPDQFSVVEDMRIAVTPESVEAIVNPDAIVSVLFAIDISGSMQGEYIEQAIRAANEFMDRLNEADRVAVVAFANTVDVDPASLTEEKEHEFTADKNAIRNVINFLGAQIDPDSDTPLYDAVYKSVKLTSGEPVGKRAVIVMTDGREEGRPKLGTGSLFTGDDAIGEATRSRVPVFTIGLGDEIDSAYLRRLALLTGGVYQETPNPEELSALTQNTLDQLKQQYVLRFETGLPYDTQPHSWILRVTLPQGEATAVHEFAFREGPPEPEPTTGVEVVPIVETPPQEAEPTAEVVATEEQPVQVAETEEPQPTEAGLEPAATQEPSGGGFLDDLRDKVEEMMDDNPILLIGIGVGGLVLIALIVALVVVVIRGRRARKGAVGAPGFDEPYVPRGEPYPAGGYTTEGGAGAGDWAAGPGLSPTPFPTPITSDAMGGSTEAAPADWAAGRPASAPYAPPPAAQAMPGFGDEDEIPLAGGTQVLQRRPGQAASLVDRASPSRRYRLSGTVTVGRATDNQIVLTHGTVSRRHAWLREEAGGWLVADAGSANGTFLNGQRIVEPRSLSNGDVVAFGKQEFLFEVFGA